MFNGGIKTMTMQNCVSVGVVASIDTLSAIMRWILQSLLFEDPILLKVRIRLHASSLLETKNVITMQKYAWLSVQAKRLCVCVCASGSIDD